MRLTRNAMRGLAGGAVVVAGVALGACSSSSSSSTTSTTTPGVSTTVPSSDAKAALAKLSAGIDKSANATFSATYVIVHGQDGQSQTVTFAQSPPKSSIQTSDTHFIVDGTAITECSGQTCNSLPSSMTGSLAGITSLFSPHTMGTVIKGLQSSALSGVTGFSAKVSSASYAGQDSTCVTVRVSASTSPVTYCAAKSSGLLTYSSAGGSTVTLTEYSATPDAALFAPPAGATVNTFPTGA